MNPRFLPNRKTNGSTSNCNDTTGWSVPGRARRRHDQTTATTVSLCGGLELEKQSMLRQSACQVAIRCNANVDARRDLDSRATNNMYWMVPYRLHNKKSSPLKSSQYVAPPTTTIAGLLIRSVPICTGWYPIAQRNKFSAQVLARRCNTNDDDRRALVDS